MAEQSMFGVIDPELIQQAIAAEKEKGMLAQAKLTPDELMRYTAMSGSSQIAQGLGGLVGSLFGVEVVDPRVKKAQQAQSIINEVNMMGLDPNSPDYYAQIAKIAAPKGLQDLAQLATSRAQMMLKTQAEIFKETAAGAASYAAAGRERTEAPLTIADRSRLKELQDQLGLVAGANAFRAERDEAERRKAAAGAQQTPTEKGILPGKAKLFGEIESAAVNSTKTLETASALDRVLNTAFTGFGADAKLRVGQLANALGVDVTGTSETEQLKQLLAQLTQGQARSLPGALSEKELAFLKEAIGTPGFTVNTLRNVVKRLRTDALASQYENEEAQKFATEPGADLNKYNFAEGKKKATQRANEEIKTQEAKLRRLQELRAKQGGL